MGRTMTDDLDALLAQADEYEQNFWRSKMVTDLAAAVRTLRADYDTALDVIARLTTGHAIGEDFGPEDEEETCWLYPDTATGEYESEEPLTDAERAVLAAAETRRQL